MAPEPAAYAEMIAVDQQDQRNERGHHRQIDHLVAVDREAAVAYGEWVQEAFPAAGDREEMHDRKAAIADDPKQADGRQNA